MVSANQVSSTSTRSTAPAEVGAGRPEMGLGSARAIITTLDQGLSSASNFAVGVIVARIAGVKGLGGFALAYAAWLLIAALHRALITDPMAITGEGRRSRSSVVELQDGLAAEMALGAIAASGVALLAVLLLVAGQKSFGLPLLMLSPWIPTLLVQDYWRWIGFMHANPMASLMNDVIFDVVQGITLGLVLASGLHSGQLVIAAWGLSGLAGAAYGLRQFRVRPKLRGGLGSLARKCTVGGWIGAGAFAGWGVGQVYSVITAVTLGPVGLGGLRAAQNLVAGPSFVLIQAGGSVGLPEAAKAYEESGWTGLKRVSRIVTVAGILSVALILVGTALFGRTVLRLLYGPSFVRFQPEALVFAVAYTVAVVSLGDILELKATKRTRPLFEVQLVALFASILGVAALSALMGAVGAAIGFGLGTTVLAAGQVRAGRRLEPLERGVEAGTPVQTGTPAREVPRMVIAAPLREPGLPGMEKHIEVVRACLETEGIRASVVTPLAAGRTASVSLRTRWSAKLQYLCLRVSLGLRLMRVRSALVYAQSPLAAKAALRAVRGGEQKVILAVHSRSSRPDVTSRSRQRVYETDQSVLAGVAGLVFVDGEPGRWAIRGPDDGADLLTVGALELHYRHAYLLEILARAAAMGRRFTLDIVGMGPQEERLLARAKALGVADQVRILRPRPDLGSMIAGHKAFVRAAYVETGPLVLAEAMSRGLPVFAPAVGLAAKVLSDGRCGVAWPLEDPYTAARLLVEVLDDPRRTAEMADAARSRFPSASASSGSVSCLARFLLSVGGQH